MDDPLAEYVRLVLAHGVGSDEAALFRSRYWHDRELLGRTQLVDHLIREIGPPDEGWPEWLK